MDEWKPTACILCECNCGLQVKLGGDGGRHLTKIRGDREHPASKGYACEKPQRLDYYQNGRDRLTSPMRRRQDGSYEAIDWDTAIREVAERFARVRDEHGGESIFYYGGGGQGNHLPGAYSAATRRALGSRYRSNALAQEKTGEFWVSAQMVGTVTRGDFEHCEVGVFLGKNPWHSHSIPRARVTLKELSKDPERTLIVIDPRRTETAELADIHVQLKPGTDAWFLTAVNALLVQRDLVDRTFVEQHCHGFEDVVRALSDVPVAQYCEWAGVPVSVAEQVAEAIGKASSVASFEDLGVQMNRHSTLVSYLHRLTWLLTGNLGKKGTQYIPTPLVSLAGSGATSSRKSPVAGAPIVAGLVPCNVIAEEVLTDHPKRYRAMLVETANPAHSLADSKRMREALGALDTLVVIDVAMTETARLADYVLPASSQFEKAEATFFNFEFPKNVFHLRRALMPAPQGLLSEAEIHARLVEQLGAFADEDLAPLHDAASRGLTAYAMAFMRHVMPNPRLSAVAPVVLYRTLGPTLPEDAREGAVLFGAAFQCAMSHRDALARAGFSGPTAAQDLFQAMLERTSGLVFAVDEWDQVLSRLGTPDKKVRLSLDDMLTAMGELAQPPAATDPSFPMVLSAGERRSFTANTIVRNPDWRKKDAGGALRISPQDAESLGLSDGDRARVTTAAAACVVPVEVSGSMQPGHVSLPNGLGVDYPGAEGTREAPGCAPNELTRSEDRDPFVGTPWHKSVPARVEAAS